MKLNCDNIIPCGEEAKYRILILHDGFDQDTDPFRVTLQWGFDGDQLTIDKRQMIRDDEGNYYIAFDTSQMRGKVTAVCSFDVPDLDFPDGLRTEVNRQYLCIVVKSPSPRFLCTPPFGGDSEVVYKRTSRPNITPYVPVLTSTGDTLLTKNGEYIYVKKSGNMKEYRLSQTGPELEALLEKIDEMGVVHATYAELVEMRDEGKFIPGVTYRITDYVTTVSGPVDSYLNVSTLRSAGHAFDILVTALDEKTLSNDAKAIQHSDSDEDYFHGSRLSDWKLKYSLDNDTALFLYADTDNGKGVIYGLTDEFGNNALYDFKNVQTLRYPMTTSAVKNSDVDGNDLRFISYYYTTGKFADRTSNPYKLHRHEGYFTESWMASQDDIVSAFPSLNLSASGTRIFCLLSERFSDYDAFCLCGTPVWLYTFSFDNGEDFLDPSLNGNIKNVILRQPLNGPWNMNVFINSNSMAPSPRESIIDATGCTLTGTFNSTFIGNYSYAARAINDSTVNAETCFFAGGISNSKIYSMEDSWFYFNMEYTTIEQMYGVTSYNAFEHCVFEGYIDECNIYTTANKEIQSLHTYGSISGLDIDVDDDDYLKFAAMTSDDPALRIWKPADE